MVIIEEYMDISNTLEQKYPVTPVKRVFFPVQDPLGKGERFTNFGAIQLQDNSVGIVFIGLTPKVKEMALTFDSNTLIGKNPYALAREMKEKDSFRKTIAFGAFNALCQSFFKAIQFPYDFNTDSMGLLELNREDVVGMVGFFPPLVRKIQKMNIRLLIIEKKEYLVQKNENWEVSLDPKLLRQCNKILCTSTTVLNESIDEILSHCKNAEKISIIGPTAGYLPDPLFTHGVDVIGGTYVSDSALFMERIEKNEKWGDSTEKYCIQAQQYPGFTNLLKKL